MFAIRMSVLAILWAPILAFSATECTRQEAIAAEEVASTLGSWADVQSAFTRFRHCDDGAIAEGFSEAVSILMAEQWAQVGSFVELAKKDRAFSQFVFRHLDETVPADRWSIIEANATDRCPTDARAVCKRILSINRELSKS